MCDVTCARNTGLWSFLATCSRICVCSCLSDCEGGLSMREFAHEGVSARAAFLEKMGQFNREKTPERVVHARGMVAKGEFEVRW